MLTCSEEKVEIAAKQLLEIDWEKEAHVRYDKEYMTMEEDHALIDSMYKEKWKLTD